MHGGFATCLVVRLDGDGRLALANAGHPPPYLNGKEGAGLDLIESEGPVELPAIRKIPYVNSAPAGRGKFSEESKAPGEPGALVQVHPA